MYFQEGSIYHIYNQSNRKATIFKDREDYKYFLGRIEKWVYPVGSILAYCIMPNHYHFLIEANTVSVKPKQLGSLSTNELSNAFRISQSQYAQFYNKKNNSSGSVFRPKTKSKNTLTSESDYLTQCFIYIHQNPVKAQMCKSSMDWEFSSAREYGMLTEVKLIDFTAARKYVLIDWSNISDALDQEIPRKNDFF